MVLEIFQNSWSLCVGKLYSYILYLDTPPFPVLAAVAVVAAAAAAAVPPAAAAARPPVSSAGTDPEVSRIQAEVPPPVPGQRVH